MVVIKDWKKYLTLDEAKALSDKQIDKDAKEFAKKVLKMQEQNTSVNKIEYV